MSNLAQKTPLQRALDQFATRKVQDGIQLVTKSLPASIVSINGWMATVKFEIQSSTFTIPNVVVPVAASDYDYLPLQKGDPGVLVAADARLGGLSELGSGTAVLEDQISNLVGLFFVPFGKKSYVAPSDPLVRVVQGPNGVTIQTLDGTSTLIVLTKTDLKMTRGSTSVELDGTNVKITGTFIINGDQYLQHTHSGVQTGGGDTGPVV